MRCSGTAFVAMLSLVLLGLGAPEATAGEWAAGAARRDDASGFLRPPVRVEPTLALPAMTLSAPGALPTLALEDAEEGGIAPRSTAAPHLLTAERARILLRSLSVPGWGQLTAGRPNSAGVFALAEVGVWASYTAFKMQVQMRRESYERIARLLAGIDLSGRDEEFRRIVGAFSSSEEYNRLVVYRDAANIYLSDLDHPDYAGYRAYIAEHELSGSDAWTWNTLEDFLKYRGQRKDAQRAALRANTVLALAVLNRLMSALHAARVATSASADGATGQSWHLEVSPSDPDDATAFRLGVRTRF